MACGFCEDALSNCVGTLLVDWVAKPVGRQFNYICCFHNNVEMLKEKKHELIGARARLQHKIEDAKRQLLAIEDDAGGLLSKADKILPNLETLESEIQKNKRCFNWCPDWIWRYRLSKKAMKNTLVICKLLVKFDQLGTVGYRSTSAIPTIEFLSSKDFTVSKSSKKAFDQIIEALQHDKVSMIGLWGMAGVGKTTLVREVGTHAEKFKLFDKVVIATVTQKPNAETIQDEIAKYLDFNMKNERGRKSRQEFWLKLQKLQKDKRILIILDDVWAKIDLKENIGIPFAEDHKGCKILLTTRRRQVCDAMECQRTIPLGCLEDNEARALFNAKAGLSDSSVASIKDVATKVIKKCQGLPIAIVTLASALKGKNLHRWEAAYRRLNNRRLDDIEDIDEKNAYLVLEVSFDYLNDKETKMCFLLCSLFPEDYEIYVEELVRYAWGIELYKGMGSIQVVRSEVLAAMDILKDSCLLLNCGERHVKMHDLVRDFALWIASNRTEFSFMIKSDVVESWPKDESFEPYKAVSFKTSWIVELPKRLLCPNLKILVLGGDEKMTTSSEFFEGMTALKVCALNSRLISPDAFQFQTNLTTLHLESCKLLDISVLGQLKKLEVLSFSCSDIKELPEEIGDLDNLKLLDLSYCEELQRIPSQLIRRLSKLEELYLHGCQLLKWATESTVRGERFASLSELNSFSNLIVLSLEVSSEDIPRDFVFCKLQRFYVCLGFGFSNFYGLKMDSEICPFSRSLKIEGSVIEACKQLLGDTKSLNLKDMVGYPNLVPSLESGQVVFSELTSLGIESCEHMKCLIDTTKQQVLTNAIPILQSLESLEVESCNEMQVLFQIAEVRSIQQGTSHRVSLQSLKVVRIDNCNKLRYLFPTSVAQSLGQLEELHISDCLELEEIIPKTEVSNINLQSLREVHVSGCNNLTSLSSLSHGQILEKLTTLRIRDCSRLEYTFPISMAEGLPQLNKVTLEGLPEFKGRDGNDIVLTLPSLQELEMRECTQFIISAEIQIAELRSIQEGTSHHVSLQSLKVVSIYNCNKLRYLFPTSVAQSLGQLEELHISYCLELEEIIPKTEVSNINLPSPREVFIAELRSIQEGPSHHVSLQSLKFVRTRNCNKLRYLFPTSVAQSLGQLEVLHISDCLELEEIIPKTEVSNINLQSLREVHVSGCNNLTSLSSLSHCQSLEKLTTLTIRDCSRLEYTFPISMAEGLPQLNKVTLEGLPEFKGRDGNDIVLTLPSLQELEMRECTQFIISAEIQIAELRSIQEGPSHHVSLQSLKFVRIHNCNKLRYLFPTSVAQSLGQLEVLLISDCLELEEIIPKTEVSNINLPSPREVFIAEVRSIQEGTSHHVSLQSLKVAIIDNCNKLRYLFPTSVAKSLGQLENLKISYCLKLEEIIPKTEVSNINLQSLRKVHVKACKNLTSLSSLSHGQSLEKLTKLRIRDCSRLEYTFPISIAEGLPQLNKVTLERLPELKGRDGNDIVLTVPSLQELCVADCPQLIPFIISANIQMLHFENMRERKQSCNMIVPKLGQKLPNMEYLTIINFEELFDGGYNLSSLRKLELDRLPELRVAWKDPIEVVNFQNLTQLNVCRCGRLRSILSLTMARNLPQLSSLLIDECEELEQIIEKDGQTSSQGHHLQSICFPNLTEIRIYSCENLKCLFPVSVAYGLPKLKILRVVNVSKLEQVFEQSGDEANGSEEKGKVIQIPQLGTLILEKLPNLVSFSSVGYHFVFPSLKFLAIRGSPNISTSFSVDSEESGHAKTEAIRSIDENIVEDSTTAQQTTWPIGSDIEWCRPWSG